jgi:hypothetical protein
MSAFTFLVAVLVLTIAGADKLVAAAPHIPTTTITPKPSLSVALSESSEACDIFLCADYENSCGMLNHGWD